MYADLEFKCMRLYTDLVISTSIFIYSVLFQHEKCMRVSLVHGESCVGMCNKH